MNRLGKIFDQEVPYNILNLVNSVMGTTYDGATLTSNHIIGSSWFLVLKEVRGEVERNIVDLDNLMTGIDPDE